MSTTRRPWANQANGMTRAGEHFRGLMAAGHPRLRRAVLVEPLDLEGRDRHRLPLVGDVIDPRRRPAARARSLRHVLVRDHHDVAAARSLRDRQAGVCRMRKRRAPIRGRDERGLAMSAMSRMKKPRVPVADVEPVAHAQRVMAARLRSFHRVVLAAGRPLARHPPAPDLSRIGRVLEVEDHHDVADIAVGGRRDIGVAAVEIEAVHARAAGAPLAICVGRDGVETS